MAFFLWFKREKVFKAALIVFALVMLIPSALLFSAAGRPEAAKAAGEPARKEQVSRGAAVSRSDLILMARVIEGEAADEPYEGKVAVGAVIVNRLQSPGFPKTVSGVIYQPDAFEAVTNGQYNRPLTKESIEAAQTALSGQDPTGGALYYWNPAKATSTWVWSRPVVTRIGNHLFAE